MKNYFLCVICGAVLCAIVTDLLDQKGASGKLLKCICGVFLITTVLRPISDLQPDPLDFSIAGIREAAAEAAAMGTDSTQQATAFIIKQETQSYIGDKAISLGGDLTVDIQLDEALCPCTATLSGEISPEGKQKLEQILQDTLGIAKEDQIWNLSWND